jgi:hypothetical protein
VAGFQHDWNEANMNDDDIDVVPAIELESLARNEDGAWAAVFSLHHKHLQAAQLELDAGDPSIPPQEAMRLAFERLTEVLRAMSKMASEGQAGQ